MRSTKLGLIRVPLKAQLDIDDVFDGRRTCLLDYLSYVSEDGTEVVTHVVYLGKKGVNSTKDGWEMEYQRKCKVVALTNREEPMEGFPNTPVLPSPKQRIVISQDRTRADTYARVFSHVTGVASDVEIASDLSDDQYPSDFSDSWDVEQKSDSEPEQRANESKQWQRKFYVGREEKLDISQTASRRIDTQNYVVFVSSAENHLSTIWKDREKRKFMHRQREAHCKLKLMTKDGVRRFFLVFYRL